MILKNGDAWCFLEIRVSESDFETRYFLIIFVNFDIKFPWNFPSPRAVKNENTRAKKYVFVEKFHEKSISRWIPQKYQRQENTKLNLKLSTRFPSPKKKHSQVQSKNFTLVGQQVN
jgi:hypothetical protein